MSTISISLESVQPPGLILSISHEIPVSLHSSTVLSALNGSQPVLSSDFQHVQLKVLHRDSGLYQVIIQDEDTGIVQLVQDRGGGTVLPLLPGDQMHC